TTGAMDAVTDHYGDRWQAQQEAKHRDRTMDVGGEDTQVRARQAADLNDPTIRDVGTRSKVVKHPHLGFETEVSIASDYAEPLGGRIGTNPKERNRPLMYSVQNLDGGELWVTTDEIKLHHYELVKDYSGQVTLLSGWEGDIYGGDHPAEWFYGGDHAEFKVRVDMPNVEVVNLNDLMSHGEFDHSEFKELINSPGRVIAAWCHSEQSNRLIVALLHP
ncbi:MAG: hypothetical protein GY845_37680, partial [Planctomycetes bacterium]|nr:hypothetical protein [Planctomycetota bacterium]